MCESHLVEQPIALENIALKTCSKCHIAKEITKFSKSKNNKAGNAH